MPTSKARQFLVSLKAKHDDAAMVEAVQADTPLTPRETEILEMIGDYASNREIAEELGISQPTVKNHVHSILGKLQCEKRMQAWVIARAKGWLQ